MARETSGILIDWFGEAYGLWCWRCGKMTEVYEAPNDMLRCTQCNWKLAEKLDTEYARLLKEGGQLQ